MKHLKIFKFFEQELCKMCQYSFTHSLSSHLGGISLSFSGTEHVQNSFRQGMLTQNYCLCPTLQCLINLALALKIIILGGYD